MSNVPKVVGRKPLNRLEDTMDLRNVQKALRPWSEPLGKYYRQRGSRRLRQRTASLARLRRAWRELDEASGG